MFSDLLLCAGVSKKKIEGVKLLGYRSLARLGGLEDILGGGLRKKTEPLGGYVRKLEILREYQNFSIGMEKNYFLSMLPLVGGSPYSRGLLLLVGSRGYPRGNRPICRGT